MTAFDDAFLAMLLIHVGLKTVLDLLKSPDESVVGNAALCLSHCADLPKVGKALVKTNIMMELLVLARDKTKPTVQHNCAILIAKLSQGDHRLKLKLRIHRLKLKLRIRLSTVIVIANNFHV